MEKCISLVAEILIHVSYNREQYIDRPLLKSSLIGGMFHELMQVRCASANLCIRLGIISITCSFPLSPHAEEQYSAIGNASISS